MRKFLEQTPKVERKGRVIYEIDGRRVDFSAAIKMPPVPYPLTNLLGAVLGGLADIPAVMQTFDAVNHQVLRKGLKKNPV